MTLEEEQKALRELWENDPERIEDRKAYKRAFYILGLPCLSIFIGSYALAIYAELEPEKPKPIPQKWYATPKYDPTREFYEVKSVDLETGEVTYFSRECATEHSSYAKMVSARSARFNKEAILEEIMDELDFWELYDEYRCD